MTMQDKESLARMWHTLKEHIYLVQYEENPATNRSKKQVL